MHYYTPLGPMGFIKKSLKIKKILPPPLKTQSVVFNI